MLYLNRYIQSKNITDIYSKRNFHVSSRDTNFWSRILYSDHAIFDNVSEVKKSENLRNNSWIFPQPDFFLARYYCMSCLSYRERQFNVNFNSLLDKLQSFCENIKITYPIKVLISWGSGGGDDHEENFWKMLCCRIYMKFQ